MSELAPRGPLDVMEDMENEVDALEELVEHYFNTDASSNDELIELVGELNQQHPAINQQVVAYGSVLTPSMDHEFSVWPLTLAADDFIPESARDEYAVTFGIYKGLGIRQIWSQEQDAQGYVLTHLIEDITPHEYFDEYGNRYLKSHITHIWSYGSSIVPALPIESHSLRDLAHDRVVREFNKFAFGEYEVTHIVQQLGRIANEALRNDEHRWDQCRQRVSYLNSLDILRFVVLEARDIVVADRDKYMAGEDIDFSTGGQLFTLWAEHFDFMPGYARSAGGVPELGLPPELFAAAHLDGTPILIPMKNVLKIRPLSEVVQI